MSNAPIVLNENYRGRSFRIASQNLNTRNVISKSPIIFAIISLFNYWLVAASILIQNPQQ